MEWKISFGKKKNWFLVKQLRYYETMVIFFGKIVISFSYKVCHPLLMEEETSGVRFSHFLAQN